MFRTLELSTEGRKRRSAAFISGLVAEILVLAGAAFLSILFPEKLPLGDKHYALAWLPTLTPPGKPAVKPPREVPRVVVPRLKTPDPLVLPTPAMAKLEVPKIQPPRVPSPAPPMLTAPPPPMQAPKEEVAVHTGLFGGAPEPVTTKLPKEQVQTGGFGNPQGFPGKAQGDNPGNVPKLGAFGLPEGPGVGNGTGGSRGVRGVVASAGFGSGVAGSGYGHGGGGNGTVATGGFEKARQVAQPTVETAQAPPPAEIQPVEILSKPSPVYTEDARRLGIQGEVVLSVVFQASGTVRVISIVRSLGHGLDQAAEQAAAHIRFKPAQRAGQPADFPATLRIEFRLADQST